MEEMSLVQMHKKYIRGTAAKVPVVEKTITIATLTVAVLKSGNFKTKKVHINTKVLKHLYDKKPAEEYDFVLYNLHLIVRYPDKIYRNKQGKSGEVAFVKSFEGVEYLCSLNFTTHMYSDGTVEEVNLIVTAYRVRDEAYLKGYKLLWSWEGGTPPS